MLSLDPLTLGVPVHCAGEGIVVSRACVCRAKSNRERVRCYGNVVDCIEAGVFVSQTKARREQERSYS
jgi:hypothetical protein